MPLPHPLLAPRDRAGFTIAIICALELEADAVLEAFDVIWDEKNHHYGRAPRDTNTYTTGIVAGHNVVLAHMPGMGVVSASTVTANLRHSFPNVALALVVGVCGAVPYSQHHDRNIFLGDLVVSTAVVQYDFGRQFPALHERKDTLEDNLGRPPPGLRAFLAKLKTRHYSRKLSDSMLIHLERVRAGRSDLQYPGQDQDILYEATYLHKHQIAGEYVTCEECMVNPQHICEVAQKTACQVLGCSTNRRVDRSGYRVDEPASTRPVHRPAIHFGRIASGSGVIKSGQHRDQISERDSVIAFEMEDAGTWDHLPSIVVKGVCDYADSHKSKEWHHYSATVAAAGVAAMLQEWESNQAGQDAEESSLSGTSHEAQRKARRWHVPFARDPEFVGRNEIIQQVHRFLQDMEYSPRVVLTGLGGVGKSQIAIEYAYQVRERTADVSMFWIYASTPARFRASFQNLARELELPGFDDPAVDQADRVYQWLQSERDSGRWLLILDNVDDISLLSSNSGAEDVSLCITRYLPQRAGGAILVTSRDRNVAARLASRLEYTIPVLTMSHGEANDLLRKKIPADAGNDTERATLLKYLDYLPLAITQTAAYIARRQRMTVRRYTELFTSRAANRIRLLTEEEPDPRRGWDVPHSVVQTWEISFAQIQAHNPLAVDLLSLMAVFDRQAVPDFLLQTDHDTMDFEDAVEVLLGYAFIEAEQNGSVLKAHRMVQLVAQAWLTREHRWTTCQERALALIDQHYPTSEYTNWTKCQILEPHVECVLKAEYQTDSAELQLASILRKRAAYLSEKGDLDSAYDSAQKSWSMTSAKLDALHPDTLASIHGVARTLTQQGNFSKAEQMWRQVITGRKSVLGLEHPDTLKSMNNLAVALNHLGQLAAAEQMHREILSVREKTSGFEHPDTLASMNNLICVLVRQRHYDAAELMCFRTLTARKRVLGPEHPATLQTSTNLARVLQDQGHFIEAEQMRRQILAASERTLGPQHPNTIALVQELAELLSQMQDEQEARRLYERACNDFASTLGDDHPETRACRREFDEFKMNKKKQIRRARTQ